MCVIIIKNNNEKLPSGVAKKSSQLNPHGLGIVWLDTYEIEHHKSDRYRLIENSNRPFIAHFRYATVGAIGKENTHPFVCGKNSNEWLMMNGTIQRLGDMKTCDSKALAINLGDKPRHTWKKELGNHACRFVTVNVRNKTFQMYNKELWTLDNGVWYSKDNVLENNLVAVYGTLKKGYSNYWHYLSKSYHIGKGHTKDKYPLIVSGLPYLIEKEGVGHNVQVDVFSVSSSVLNNLDALEGHPNWYRRKQIDIQVGRRVLKCWIYFNIQQHLNKDSEMHASYTQSYKPIAKSTIEWWDGVPEKKGKKKKEKQYPEVQSFYFEDDFSAVEETPYCVSCYNDLKYDGFSHYHCSSCGAWYNEHEAKKTIRPR